MSVQTDELSQGVRSSTWASPPDNRYLEVAKNNAGPGRAGQAAKEREAAQAARDWRRSAVAVSPLARPLLLILTVLVALWGMFALIGFVFVTFPAANWAEDLPVQMMRDLFQHMADVVLGYALLPVVTFGPQLIVALVVLLRCYYAVHRGLHRRRRRGQE